MSRPTVTGVILSGLILAGLPFLAIAQHWHVQAKDARFAVPSQLAFHDYTENVDIDSEINRLDLEQLSGTDNISVRDTVYVHMASGPGMIAYPFGISKTRTASKREEHAFSLRGTVMAREGAIIDIRYNFETFLPTREMKPALASRVDAPVLAELAVNDHSVARLVAIEIGGVRYPYRVIEKPVLKGLTR